MRKSKRTRIRGGQKKIGRGKKKKIKKMGSRQRTNNRKRRKERRNGWRG